MVEEDNKVNIDDIVDSNDDDKSLTDDILDDYTKNIEKEEQEEQEEIEKSKKVEETKVKPKKSAEMTQEYLNEVIMGFLKHYKKKKLMRVKSTQQEVEIDVDFYMRKIRDIYQKNNPFLIINFKDLIDYQEHQILDKESISRVIYLLTNQPYTVRKIFTFKTKEIFKDIFKDEFETNFVMQDLYKQIQVGFTQFQDKPTQLNDLRAKSLSKFATVEGVISQFDEKPLVHVEESTWNCDHCNRLYVQKGGKPPTRCLSKDCSSRSFTEDLARQVNYDYMDMRLTQQYTGAQKTITVDRYVRVAGIALVNYVLNNISPGQIAIVNGPIVLSEFVNPKDSKTGGDIEIDAFCVEQKNNVNIFDYDERLLNLVKDPINATNIEAHVNKLKRSVCSHIYKQELMKESVLLMAIGTDPIRRNDGTRRKGDINILNCGPSGVAKSDYSKWLCNVLPHSMRAGTEGSTSVAGLTTYVETNQKTGRKAMNLGILALCDLKGVACVEEINRRSSKALDEFANATDDNQQILVNKGSFHAAIYSRCPIYATANSLDNNGIWNDNESVTKQTKLDSFILQRMDIIFVTREEKSKEYKEKLMDHLEAEGHNIITEKEYIQAEEAKNHLEKTEEVLKETEAKLRAGDFTGVYPIEYMRHELYYLKTLHCRLVPKSEAWAILRKFWVEYSTTMGKMTMMQSASDDFDKIQADPMDVRKWNSLQKIAETYGLAYRCNEVLPEHAYMTINLMSNALASMIPQIGALDNQEQIDLYAKKMMDKSTSSSIARTLSREKAELKRNTYHKFLTELNKFNNILYKQGHRVCATCHGTGQTTEIVDSELRSIETHNCLDCNGVGGFDEPFESVDFIDNIVNSQVMSQKRCQFYLQLYLKKGFLIIENGHYYHNIDFKAPSTIDAIKLIAENFADDYMKKIEEDEAIRNMNKRKMVMPTRASELNKREDD